MSPQEAAALVALRAWMRTVQKYNALIDTPGFDSWSPEYATVADAMEEAMLTLQIAAEPLFSPDDLHPRPRPFGIYLIRVPDEELGENSRGFDSE